MSGRFIKFTVIGKPSQVGSKRAFVAGMKSGNPRAVMVNDNSERQKQWYNAVAQRAAQEMEMVPQFTGPLRLGVIFFFKRPKSHYYQSKRRFGELKDDAPKCYYKKPDLDKLMRNLKDALTSVVWRDDAQVCEYGLVRKSWAEDGIECASILIEEIIE